MTTKKELARDIARAELAQLLSRAQRDEYSSKPIVYFITRSVAPSGMSRVFSVYVSVDGELRGLDHGLSQSFDYTETRKGFRVSGCGMDMRFAVCDDMASVWSVSDSLSFQRASGNDFDYRSL